jgi:phosphatidylethanolamine-binding protein (PEBP) family uncharacterized protein
MVNPVGWMLRGVRSGDRRGVLSHPELAAADTIHLTSWAFRHGAALPLSAAGAGVGDDVSPALNWGRIPEGTRQLLLVVEDIDVPFPRPIIHTVALVPPDARGLIEGGLAAGVPGVRFIPGSLRTRGWLGPRPIPGHGPHHYGFHLFALDTVVEGEPRSLRDALPQVAGHVLARGSLVGTCER